MPISHSLTSKMETNKVSLQKSHLNNIFLPPLNDLISLSLTNVNQDTTESRLVFTLKNLIRGNQYFGSFPFKISHKRLSHKFNSFPPWWCIFLLIIESFVIFGYISSSAEQHKSLEITRVTEKISFALSYTLTIVYSIVCRIHGLFFHKKTLTTWGELCSGIDKLQGSRQILNSNHFSTLRGDLRCSVSLIFFVFLAFTGCISAAFFTVFFPTEDQPEIWYGFVVHFSMTIIFSWSTCANLMYMGWLMAPIRVTEGLFLHLNDALNEISEELGHRSSGFICPSRLQNWVADYTKVKEILESCKKSGNISLLLTVGYASVQITCESYSVISLLAMRSIYPAATRTVKLMLHLIALYQLANHAGKLREVQGVIYSKLCQVEVLIGGTVWTQVRVVSTELIVFLKLKGFQITVKIFVCL
ncbi:uncharacterized protein LOC110849965 isoform X2 [Folsomia candida]|uniref:uncharacterized protein LOC110849965 isoform X2 n=1 Tax=Folsomia candida TaxID=158441 RepID=UPI001604ABD4|nr:uncharacterized protein LOC110849965 isoform X2 [Folsomia candida]